MCTRLAIAILCLSGFLVSNLASAPVPVDTKKEVAERAGFIPQRKNVALPGKIVAVLVSDAQAVLGNEGRGGAADHLCIAWNGCSYRWAWPEHRYGRRPERLPVSSPSEPDQYKSARLSASRANMIPLA